MNLKDFPKGESIAPMQSGTYNAVCCGLVDLGTQTFEFAGSTYHKPQLLLIFEFPEEQIEVDGEWIPRNLSAKYNKSKNEKSNFCKMLTSWRGRGFTEDELNDFDLSRLLGVRATVIVASKESGGKTVSFISSVGKPMKSNQHQPSRKILFDLTDSETYDSVHLLTKWQVEEINRSAEAVQNGLTFGEDGGVSPSRAGGISPPIQDEPDDIPF